MNRDNLRINLDLNMSAFNAGIRKATKSLDGLIRKYKEALELQQKLKEGESNGHDSETREV